MSDLDIPKCPRHGMGSSRSELKYAWILGTRNRRSKLNENFSEIFGGFIFHI